MRHRSGISKGKKSEHQQRLCLDNRSRCNLHPATLSIIFLKRSWSNEDKTDKKSPGCVSGGEEGGWSASQRWNAGAGSRGLSGLEGVEGSHTLPQSAWTFSTSGSTKGAGGTPARSACTGDWVPLLWACTCRAGGSSHQGRGQRGEGLSWVCTEGVGRAGERCLKGRPWAKPSVCRGWGLTQKPQEWPYDLSHLELGLSNLWALTSRLLTLKYFVII